MAYQSPAPAHLPSPVPARAPSLSPKVEPTNTYRDTQNSMHNPLFPDLYRPNQEVYEKTRDIAIRPLVRQLRLKTGRRLDYLHNDTKGLLNYKTALAYQRGDTKTPPCAGCALQTGGPFQDCVALKGEWKGSCTNCAYQGNASRCSFRLDEEQNSSFSEPKRLAEQRENTDRTTRTIIHLEEREMSENTGGSDAISEHSAVRATDGLGHDSNSGSASTGYIRRQAAVKAETRLANYGYGDRDVTEHGSIDGEAEGNYDASAAWGSTFPGDFASPNTKLKTRTKIRFTPDQEDVLYLERRKDPSRPSDERRRAIAKAVGCTPAQIENWFRNKTIATRSDEHLHKEYAALARIDEANPNASTEELIQMATAKLTRKTETERQPINVISTESHKEEGDHSKKSSPSASGTKLCKDCDQTKPLSQFREFNKYGITGVPNTRKSFCIPCDDKKKEARNSLPRTSQGSASSKSARRIESGSTSNGIQPSASGSNHPKGTFTAKRGGRHSSLGRTKSEDLNGTAQQLFHDSTFVVDRPLVHPLQFIFTLDQTETLEAEYKKDPKLSDDRIIRLCEELGCKRDSIRNWFSKRNRGLSTDVARSNDEAMGVVNDSSHVASRKRERGEDGSQDNEPIATKRKTTHTKSNGTLEQDSPHLPVTDSQGFVLAQLVDLLGTTTSRTITTLSRMQPVRPVDWNPKVNANLKHTFNVEAAMGFCVGSLAPSPCTHCSRGNGGFTRCVIVPGLFGESCVNCHYNRMSNRCSFWNGEIKSGRSENSPTPSSKQGKQASVSSRNNHKHTPRSLLQSSKDDTAPVQSPQKSVTETQQSNTASDVPLVQPHQPSTMNSPAAEKPFGQRELVEPSQPAPQAAPQSIPQPAPQPAPQVASLKPTVRSARYLKVLAEIEQMPLSEQELERLDIKFQFHVLSNVLNNDPPVSRSSRYHKQEAEVKEMTLAEQELELATLSFRLSVLDDAINRGKAT